MCLSLVPKVTTVEHIKGPAYRPLLLPGERTADRITEEEITGFAEKEEILK
jgi:hypothetical protein